MKFEPTYESVNSHKIPDWYDDAKFGIFFHWGPYSVPAYAKKGGNLNDMVRATGENIDAYGIAAIESPYSEWYLNKMKIDGSSTQKYHRKHYGDKDYFSFQKDLEEQSAANDFGEWAEVCKNAGAKYVVLVTKHHDGYCLWPSEIKNPQMPKYQSERDIVGELTNAVRARGMKMGLYYSGVFDWTFIKSPINSTRTFIKQHLTSNEYCDYAVNQIHDLIERYHPSVLWNDIGFPSQCDMNELFAYYYCHVPEGIVNDRWKQYRLPDGVDAEKQLDIWVEEGKKRMETDGLAGLIENNVHHDFICPEYATSFEYNPSKWELCRGVGMSFAYNAQETQEDMLDYPELVRTLVDVVSKNGNLLLNIGPKGDGTIPDMQKKPLMRLGEWLKKNGESIYGTRCWSKQEDVTADGSEVRYTQKPNALYVFIMNAGIPKDIALTNLEIPEGSKIELLSDGRECSWEQGKNGLIIHSEHAPDEPIHVFKVSVG